MTDREIEVRDYTYHRLEIWRDKHDLSRDEAMQELLNSVGATSLTSGYERE